MDQLNILDLDLDFFLNERATNKKMRGSRRLNKKIFVPWTDIDVINFLNGNCGLSTNTKIYGKIFTEHDELFAYLRELQEQNNFEFTFSIDHVDAHADLGLGDNSYTYISTSVLHKSLKDRYYLKNRNKYSKLSPGNFLSYLIACNCVTELNYINHPNWFNDIPLFHMKDCDNSSNYIQLKKYTKQGLKNLFNRLDLKNEFNNHPPISLEPAVQFNKIEFDKFKNNKNYDYVFLTQSPTFTPRSSDILIPIIKNYMNVLP